MIERGVPMKREDERETILLAKAGDKVAIEKVIRCNMGLVYQQATEFRRYNVLFDDLVSEGVFGLLNALDKFDPKYGTKFITFARFWVRMRIFDHVMYERTHGTTRRGESLGRFHFSIRKMWYEAQTKADASDMDALQVFTDMYCTARGTPRKTGGKAHEEEFHATRLVLSIDRPASLNSETSRPGTSLLDGLQEQDGSNPEELCAQLDESVQLLTDLHAALKHMSERERYVLQNCLFDEDPKTLAEAGEHLGVSRERVRQIRNVAKRKLQFYMAKWRRACAA